MRLLLQTIRLSVFSLLLHKLRSALAVLGILIGITAVIWLVLHPAAKTAFESIRAV